ncbi:MAG TPA: FMN-binding protein [Candidatus Dormibacteraeota bacterium]|nr:FMN-binding protein [Candidatus Dormibacteraeota bacterium]
MPTRAAVALITTAIAVVLLFSFKTPAQARPRTPAADLAQATPTTTASPTPSDSSGTTPTPTPTPSNAGPTYKDGQYTGRDVVNQFGDTQVKVTISGGRITDVQPLQLPFDRQRSAEISQYAAPLLHDEVLQAQSAQIDSLSGATYTSDAYAQSVQAALDQAHA